jgi:arylsulfatase A-like enzyme
LRDGIGRFFGVTHGDKAESPRATAAGAGNDDGFFQRCMVTNSICGPSRATILTGKHSHANGFTVNENTHFDGTQQTFPKLLQKAGYETALIGKWHLGSDPTGFNHWDILPGQGFYYNPDFRTTNGRYRVNGYPKPRLSIPGKGHKKYPYLLRNLEIERSNQVWCTDITYIPLGDGHVYLTAVMDWSSRYVIS